MAVAVPGEIAGYAAAWRRYGRLPWAELFWPTIQLCEEGFPVTAAIQTGIDSAWEALGDAPNLR